MPWQKLSLGEEEKLFLTNFKRRPRFLLDENVDSVIEQLLQQRCYKVKSVAGTPNAGKEDQELYEVARQEQRIITTHNGRDFWDDSLCPIDKGCGVAILDAPEAIGYMLQLMGRWAELWFGMKAWFYTDGHLKIKCCEFKTGRITTTQFRLAKRRDPEIWVE